MNKIVLGSMLIAVMGGTPTVTYFLTTEGTEEKAEALKDTKSPKGKSSTCTPQNVEGSCPETPVPV